MSETCSTIIRPTDEDIFECAHEIFERAVQDGLDVRFIDCVDEAESVLTEEADSFTFYSDD